MGPMAPSGAPTEPTPPLQYRIVVAHALEAAVGPYALPALAQASPDTTMLFGEIGNGVGQEAWQ
jgi:hypothetical protein